MLCRGKQGGPLWQVGHGTRTLVKAHPGGPGEQGLSPGEVLIFLLVVKVMKKVQKLDNCQSYPKKNVTPNSFIFTMASMTVIQLYH